MKSVPSPSHDAKPKTSVSVVIKTKDASTGSTFIARSQIGHSSGMLPPPLLSACSSTCRARSSGRFSGRLGSLRSAGLAREYPYQVAQREQRAVKDIRADAAVHRFAFPE